MPDSLRTIILCGGRGMRLAAHIPEIPKPLVEVGGRPLLFHILRHYSHYGFRDFVLALGYRGEAIKAWFLESPAWRRADCVLQPDGEIRTMEDVLPEARLEFRDTGLDSQTGERIRRLRGAVSGTFFATYGDGLADIDLQALLDYHRAHGRVATVTVVQPRSTFGLLDLDDKDRVVSFREKPRLDSWVNGGFFVFEERLFEFLGPNQALETEPMERLAAAGELVAYRHDGFWQCMDTYKDTVLLNQMWQDGGAPWVPRGTALG